VCGNHRSGSSGLSSLPTPRGGSGPGSLDEGSDNGRHTDPDSPFDLSLARCLLSPLHLPAKSKMEASPVLVYSGVRRSS
jgi:hypothetical protein